MSSTSETGHAKIISNFDSLISFCTGYGARYNPSRDALKTENLTTLHDAAETANDDLKEELTNFNNATNARRDLFRPLKKLATKIINALDATDATEATVNNAKTINRKMQGGRAGEKAETLPATNGATETTAAQKSVSVSQQSFDQMIEHFASLITVLAAEPNYTPNENELTVTALANLVTAMKATNKAVKDAVTAIENSRITRNDLLYKIPAGLVPVAADVKKYVKSVFGVGSPQFKQVSSISFKTLKDYKQMPAGITPV